MTLVSRRQAMLLRLGMVRAWVARSCPRRRAMLRRSWQRACSAAASNVVAWGAAGGARN